MNIVILDDYQDAVRKLACARPGWMAYPAKVYTNTVKGIGQLSVQAASDADIIVLIRERTHLTRPLHREVATD
jgi:D-3-phosphoglycerate dehydrogenase